MIAAIEHALQLALKTARPEFPGVATVEPLLDPARGDLSSRCAIAAAAWGREDPDRVAAAVVGALPAGAVPGRVEVQQGFINITLNMSRANLLGPPEQPARLPARVVLRLMPPRQEFAGLRWLRLGARVAVQVAAAGVLGIPVEVWVGRDHLGTPSPGELMRLLATLALSAGADGEAARRLTELADELSPTDHLWIAPDFMSRRDFREFYRRAVVQRGAALYCPAREWFDVAGTIPPDLTEMEAWSLGILLASELAGGDIDPASAILAERHNLRWFAQTLRRRGMRLGVRLVPRLEVERELTVASEATRALLIRCKLLLLFLGRAAAAGEVGPFLSAYGDLLNRFNGLVNDPEVRRALAVSTGAIPGYIVTGVVQLLSDKMLEPFVGEEQA